MMYNIVDCAGYQNLLEFPKNHSLGICPARAESDSNVCSYLVYKIDKVAGRVSAQFNDVATPCGIDPEYYRISTLEFTG